MLFSVFYFVLACLQESSLSVVFGEKYAISLFLSVCVCPAASDFLGKDLVLKGASSDAVAFCF